VHLIGRIGPLHGAIVAATGRSDRRGDRRRDNRREDRPVYRHYMRSSRRPSPVGCSIKQVFVAATIAYSVYTGRLSRRRLPRRSPWQSRQRSSRVYALLLSLASHPDKMITITLTHCYC